MNRQGPRVETCLSGSYLRVEILNTNGVPSMSRKGGNCTTVGYEVHLTRTLSVTLLCLANMSRVEDVLTEGIVQKGSIWEWRKRGLSGSPMKPNVSPVKR